MRQRLTVRKDALITDFDNGLTPYEGCYPLPSGDDTAILTGPTIIGRADMTLEVCKKFCSSATVPTPGAPYPYFAVARGTDCYCGSETTATAEATNANCDASAGGNPLQRAGSSTHASIWLNTQRAPAACPATITCPANDGCTYTGSGSRTFRLDCGVDYAGGNIAGSRQVADIQGVRRSLSWVYVAPDDTTDPGDDDDDDTGSGNDDDDTCNVFLRQGEVSTLLCLRFGPDLDSKQPWTDLRPLDRFDPRILRQPLDPLGDFGGSANIREVFCLDST
ncbi:hypothetical protein OPT61_g10379 [Boeremia exigua]|uniref:Uncharacterized protein n=1 Tax=Boeremia exigua TaxID=749465 RepID=A0ACC2HQR3_9PLEO|nr:hypothetical protein OPT61_g10379 [Boeremia exigua]